MDWQLDAPEARVLGALLEKEIATPEYYPLSLNALVNACNQKSNREPVVSYDEDTVESALAGLRAKGLAVRITGESRVPKHGQRFTENLNLGRREAALICLLLLRGPQTVGELRGRSDRLYSFDGLEAVESTIQRLSEAGLVKKLPRIAGFRCYRATSLLRRARPNPRLRARRSAMITRLRSASRRSSRNLRNCAANSRISAGGSNEAVFAAFRHRLAGRYRLPGRYVAVLGRALFQAGDGVPRRG